MIVSNDFLIWIFFHFEITAGQNEHNANIFSIHEVCFCTYYSKGTILITIYFQCLSEDVTKTPKYRIYFRIPATSYLLNRFLEICIVG